MGDATIGHATARIGAMSSQRRPFVVAAIAVAIVVALAASCSGDEAPGPANEVLPTAPSSRSASTPGVPTVAVEVLDRIPHDPAAFTQGLEIADGVGFESTGLYGESTVRRFDPRTGAVTDSAPLDDALFGEGLTVTEAGIVQLTWRAGTAFVRDPESLDVVTTFTYQGEGWGICEMPSGLLAMSDGSSVVALRDPDDFSVVQNVEVRLDGAEVTSLNELECIGDDIVANVWGASQLVVFSPIDGDVSMVIDAGALVAEVADDIVDERRDVLNGVARLDDGTLLLTGKRWPTTFRVEVAGLG